MSARTFDKLTAFDNMGVRMVDGNVEAEGLEQDVLIAHQLLGLQCVMMKERFSFNSPYFQQISVSNLLDMRFCVTSVRYCSDLESSCGLSLWRQIYDTCKSQHQN